MNIKTYEQNACLLLLMPKKINKNIKKITPENVTPYNTPHFKWFKVKNNVLLMQWTHD